LGLSICRSLAAVLGGRIAVQSELGAGAKFSLSLPRRALAVTAGPGTEEESNKAMAGRLAG